MNVSPSHLLSPNRHQLPRNPSSSLRSPYAASPSKSIDVNLNINLNDDGTVSAQTQQQLHPQFQSRPSLPSNPHHFQGRPIPLNLPVGHGYPSIGHGYPPIGYPQMPPQMMGRPFRPQPQGFPHPNSLLMAGYPAYSNPIQAQIQPVIRRGMARKTEHKEYTTEMEEQSVFCVLCNEDYKLSEKEQHILKHQKRPSGGNRDKIKQISTKLQEDEKPISRPIVEPEEFNIQYNPNKFVLEKGTRYNTPLDTRLVSDIRIGTDDSLIHEKPQSALHQQDPQFLLPVENERLHSGETEKVESVRMETERIESVIMDNERVRLSEDNQQIKGMTYNDYRAHQTVRKPKEELYPEEVQLSPNRMNANERFSRDTFVSDQQSSVDPRQTSNLFGRDTLKSDVTDSRYSSIPAYNNLQKTGMAEIQEEEDDREKVMLDMDESRVSNRRNTNTYQRAYNQQDSRQDSSRQESRQDSSRQESRGVSYESSKYNYNVIPAQSVNSSQDMGRIERESEHMQSSQVARMTSTQPRQINFSKKSSIQNGSVTPTNGANPRNTQVQTGSRNYMDNSIDRNTNNIDNRNMSVQNGYDKSNIQNSFDDNRNTNMDNSAQRNKMENDSVQNSAQRNTNNMDSNNGNLRGSVSVRDNNRDDIPISNILDELHGNNRF